MKISDYIFKKIYEMTKTNTCYFLSGGGIMHLCDSLGRNSDIKGFSMLHEQAVAIAADAHGRVNNKIGLALVTTGPGATNAITGVSGAYLESTPMIMISGQVSKTFYKGNLPVRQLGFQEIDIVSMVKSCTKYAVTVTEPNEIKYHLEKAIHLAKSGRPGPVWLDIPLDVQGATIEEENLVGFYEETKEDEIQTEELRSLISLIENSRRPIILGGHGVWLSDSGNLFRELIEKLDIPVQTSWNGIDLIEEEHPLFYGRPNSYGPRYPNIIIQNSDLIISLGCRLGIQQIGYNYKGFAPDAKIVMVDIDKAELEKPTLDLELPININVKCVLEKLLTEKIELPNIEKWKNWCLDIKNAYPVIEKSYYDDKFVDPHIFVEELSKECSEDMIIVPASSGTSFTVCSQQFKIKKGQRYFTSKGHAAMGYGLPSSIGACVGSGLKKTVTAIGDGGFQMNLQELQVVSANKLPLKIFIFNNESYLSIKVTQKKYFAGNFVGSTPESGVTLPSLKKLANTYGIRYEIITNHEELTEKIQVVLNGDEPVLCEVMMEPEKTLFPKLSSKKNTDGTMVSRDIDDMEPFIDKEKLEAIRSIRK